MMGHVPLFPRPNPNKSKRRNTLSHVVTIRTEIRDLAAIQAACRRLNLERPKQGTFTLYSGEATGVAVRLPDWAYPCVFDLATGQAKYDNFGGHWKGQT
jgi:hypothetical protein